MSRAHYPHPNLPPARGKEPFQVALERPSDMHIEEKLFLGRSPTLKGVAGKSYIRKRSISTIFSPFIKKELS